MSSEKIGCQCVEQCMEERCKETPPWCPTKVFPHLREDARSEYKKQGTLARNYWQAFSRLVGSGGAQRSRLEHIMEFSRAAGFKKIGLAGCAGYVEIMHTTVKVLESHGFEAMYIVCKVHGNHFSDININKESDWTLCNPLGQALLLNEWGADLNVQVGLCMGHDLIFNHYSDAPVTVLIVKEKISHDNPGKTISRIGNGKYQTCPYMPDSSLSKG